jgi:hypothetical protein
MLSSTSSPWHLSFYDAFSLLVLEMIAANCSLPFIFLLQLNEYDFPNNQDTA